MTSLLLLSTSVSVSSRPSRYLFHFSRLSSSRRVPPSRNSPRFQAISRTHRSTRQRFRILIRSTTCSSSRSDLDHRPAPPPLLLLLFLLLLRVALVTVAVTVTVEFVDGDLERRLSYLECTVIASRRCRPSRGRSLPRKNGPIRGRNADGTRRDGTVSCTRNGEKEKVYSPFEATSVPPAIRRQRNNDIPGARNLRAAAEKRAGCATRVTSNSTRRIAFLRRRTVDATFRLRVHEVCRRRRSKRARAVKLLVTELGKKPDPGTVEPASRDSSLEGLSDANERALVPPFVRSFVRSFARSFHRRTGFERP